MLRLSQFRLMVLTFIALVCVITITSAITVSFMIHHLQAQMEEIRKMHVTMLHQARGSLPQLSSDDVFQLHNVTVTIAATLMPNVTHHTQSLIGVFTNAFGNISEAMKNISSSLSNASNVTNNSTNATVTPTKMQPTVVENTEQPSMPKRWWETNSHPGGPGVSYGAEDDTPPPPPPPPVTKRPYYKGDFFRREFKRYDEAEWEDEVAEEEERERERVRDLWRHRDRMYAKRVRRWQEEEQDDDDRMRRRDSYQNANPQSLGVGNQQYLGTDMNPNKNCKGMDLMPLEPYSLWWRKGTQGQHDYAYVTFVTSPPYVMGAAVLMYSIARTQSQYARMICVTKEISQHDRILLSVFGQVMEIDKIPSPRFVDNARYADTFTKLRVWELIMFKKVLYIDTDVIILKNVDDLFDLNELSLPMDAEQDRYSTGMMLLEPSNDTFNEMMVALNTTTVSMELPDLLFLKEFFENKEANVKPTPATNRWWGGGIVAPIKKHVINIIPRWYQVYQEEFGSQYHSYLVQRKIKMTIHDPRIHGMHYPGNSKPWLDFDKRTEKYKNLLCDWTNRQELIYESGFLWFRMWTLMKMELKHSISPVLFDAEGGEIINLKQWMKEELIRREIEARKNTKPSWYSNNYWNSYYSRAPGGSNGWNWWSPSTPAPPSAPIPTEAFTYRWELGSPKNKQCRIPAYGIDLSGMIPFVALLPQNWVGHDKSTEMYMWVVTWCTSMFFTPEESQPCNRPSNVAQFSGGKCWTPFADNTTLHPILGGNHSDEVLGVVLTTSILLTDSAKPRWKTMYIVVRCDETLENDFDAFLDHREGKEVSSVRIEDDRNPFLANRHYFLYLKSRCACRGGCDGLGGGSGVDDDEEEEEVEVTESYYDEDETERGLNKTKRYGENHSTTNVTFHNRNLIHSSRRNHSHRGTLKYRRVKRLRRKQKQLSRLADEDDDEMSINGTRRKHQGEKTTEKSPPSSSTSDVYEDEAHNATDCHDLSPEGCDADPWCELDEDQTSCIPSSAPWVLVSDVSSGFRSLCPPYNDTSYELGYNVRECFQNAPNGSNVLMFREPEDGSLTVCEWLVCQGVKGPDPPMPALKLGRPHSKKDEDEEEGKPADVYARNNRV
eukprot:PhF_6_TR44266/c0_g1_i1/m.68183